MTRVPRVANLRRRHVFDVYVGRPSVWGNPFREGRDGARHQVIAKYRAWLLGQPELVERARRELRGKVLGCWCSPKPCHADVLLEVANVIPMRLACPACHAPHVDRGEWALRPHRTHLCERCGAEWRPSDRHTVGVA